MPGIFQDKDDVFITHEVRLRFRDKIMGGIPGDPKVVLNWLRVNLHDETKKEEIQRLALQTLQELGVPLPGGAREVHDLSLEEIEEVLEDLPKEMADRRNTNCFKQDENGLYIESRQVKAGIKEVTNILWAGGKWGRTNKGPKNFVAERIFVNPARIYLGVPEADGFELFVGHVSGPRGPQSTLTHYQYVERPVIEFQVLATKDADEVMDWPTLWKHFEENGLGALRSQDHGRFDIIKWDDIEEQAPISEAAD